jgi:predicted RNase H-like HicB family nuclease
MERNIKVSVLIRQEDDQVVAWSPDVDIASQGDTIEQAQANLLEAIELWLETASQPEILSHLPELATPAKTRRLPLFTQLEVPVGRETSTT